VLSGLLIAWAALAVLSLFAALLSNVLLVLALFCFLPGSAFLGYHVIDILLAKGRVLDKHEVPLLFGFLKLVAWDPTEGVLFLKNKAVSFVDDNLYDGGGIKLIYPVMGEELVLRAPLETQSLDFADEKVITREYLALTVRGTMKWRITDLERFYLLVSRELHFASDRGTHGVESRAVPDRVLLPDKTGRTALQDARLASRRAASHKCESAEEWLRWIAEEQTRTIVSNISTGLLVAEQIASDLPSEMQHQVHGQVINPIPIIPSATTNYRSATDGLAAAIHDTVRERVYQYGIEVDDVSLQEVQLPAEIHQQCVEACKATYFPLIAQKKAMGRKMELQAEADVIGAATLGAREVASVSPAYALSDFLSEFIGKNAAFAGAAAAQAGALVAKTQRP
jgi:regulator of protease activity HflC (stomatin/prohibitin superfamily)